MEPTSSKPTLYYFDGYGRAEPIRMAFHYAKEDFTDIRLSGEKFYELKVAKTLPLGQVPVLEVDNKKYTQSISILRLYCQKWGYYPNDPEMIYAAEALVDFRWDATEPILKSIFVPDSEEKRANLKSYYENVLPEKLKYLNEFYKKYSGGNGYLVGKTMTIADFVWLDFYFRIFLESERKEYGEKVLGEFPELKKYWEERSEKDWKEYLAKRPASTFFAW